MALIGKIRKNSWLLIVVIGLALAAFVMMDMFSNNQRSSSITVLGTINGKKLDYNEFQRTQQALYSSGGTNLYAQRDFMWDFFVEEYMLQDEFESLGLGVGMPEIMELEFGNNLSPMIRQQFTNPNTGQLDRAQLNQYRQALQSGDDTDPQIAQLKREWLYQRKVIVKDRMKDKINGMVMKGIYTPSWMSASGNPTANTTLSFEAVKVPFEVISDDQTPVTDEELKAYIKDHAAKYELAEETRTMEYVAFDVIASPADSAAILDKMITLKEQFAATSNDTNFVRANRGTFGPEYVKAQFVNSNIVDSVFSNPVGSVVGPYLDNGQYRLAKIVDRKMIPDSVRSRHILRQVQTQEQAQAAFLLIDSLKTEIEAGNMTFEQAAQQFGMDATRDKGGDLGFAFPGQMVKQFNDLIFYHAEPGELRTIVTQFGLHLVEVTDRKYINEEEGVRLAYLFEDIIPSDATQQEEFDKVYDFVRQNRDYTTLKNSVESNPNMRLVKVAGLKRNDHTLGALGSNDASRNIIRWIYSSGVKKLTVSNEVYVFKHPTLFYSSRYVVAALTGISGGKLTPLEEVRDEVTLAVMNDKKASILKERMAGKDLLQLSSEYGVDIANIEDVSFETAFLTDLGNEPKALGAAINMNIDDISEPIKGSGGMLVIKLNNKVEGMMPSGLNQMQNLAGRNMKTQTNLRLWDALKDKADVEDNRSSFF